MVTNLQILCPVIIVTIIYNTHALNLTTIMGQS